MEIRIEPVEDPAEPSPFEEERTTPGQQAERAAAAGRGCKRSAQRPQAAEKGARIHSERIPEAGSEDSFRAYPVGQAERAAAAGRGEGSEDSFRAYPVGTDPGMTTTVPVTPLPVRGASDPLGTVGRYVLVRRLGVG